MIELIFGAIAELLSYIVFESLAHVFFATLKKSRGIPEKTAILLFSVFVGYISAVFFPPILLGHKELLIGNLLITPLIIAFFVQLMEKQVQKKYELFEDMHSFWLSYTAALFLMLSRLGPAFLNT